MKKKIFIFTVLIVMSIVFTGCGSAMPYDNYDLDDYIKVGKYKGLKVDGYTVKVTENDIDTYIQSTLEASPKTEKLEKGDAIEDGDTLNIDYEGRIDGKKFEGGSNESDELTIGSDKFISGFEDGLIGKTVGDEVELNLTFPENYDNKKLRGKDVVFDVKINSATRETIPEYDLDYVKENTKYKSLKAYENAVAKQLYTEKETEAVNNQKTTLWSEALENTKVKKYPEEELEYYIQFNSDQIDEMAKTYGMKRKEMLSSYGFGNEKEFKAVNEDSSKMRVKQEMLIKYIADKEGLEYTDDEKEALIADFEKQGYDAEAVESQTGREIDEYVHIELLYGKVLDFLLEKAEITETSKKADK